MLAAALAWSQFVFQLYFCGAVLLEAEESCLVQKSTGVQGGCIACMLRVQKYLSMLASAVSGCLVASLSRSAEASQHPNDLLVQPIGSELSKAWFPTQN